MDERRLGRRTSLRFNASNRSSFRALFLLLNLWLIVDCDVISLNSDNIDNVFRKHEVVLVNFYADWCRFSQQLMPLFEEASNMIKDAAVAGKLAWASVDSDRQSNISQRYHVSKYPTLKLFRHGEMKKEYRGSRSVSALLEFVRKQLNPPSHMFASMQSLKAEIDRNKVNLIAYFDKASGPEYDNFQKVASILRDDCAFWYGVGSAFVDATKGVGAKLEFWPKHDENKVEYVGGLSNYESMRQWITDHCVPLVREITFENAEGLTEEGLPFLLYFRKAEDTSGDKIFADQVARELRDQKGSVNCLFADGKQFAHPLQHLGKSQNDLPIIAIDSFRHMYLFPDMRELTVPGKLRQFVLDLHSGKLHREFHHGPDPTLTPDSPIQNDQTGEKALPPISIFQKLKPSARRYTFNDEL